VGTFAEAQAQVRIYLSLIMFVVPATVPHGHTHIPLLRSLICVVVWFGLVLDVN
jgi:hypothetical protein